MQPGGVHPELEGLAACRLALRVEPGDDLGVPVGAAADLGAGVGGELVELL